jgi:glycogen debranching enzyme
MTTNLVESPELPVEQTSTNGNGQGHGPEPFYIVAASPTADEQSLVLKRGDTFAVFDHFGDITPAGLGEEGIYHGGTRFLSRLLLGLGRHRPLFLSSTVKDDNNFLAVDMTNPDVSIGGQLVIPRGTLHLSRIKFLSEGICYERLRLRSYQAERLETTLLIQFAADYADIFEVRGARRAQHGRSLPEEVSAGEVVLGYEGLDQVVRRTRIAFHPAPTLLRQDQARFDVALPPLGEAIFDVITSCETGTEHKSVTSFDEATARAGEEVKSARQQTCSLRGSDERFNDWVSRARADLHMMTTDTDRGPYPYAGVPWFSTPFGRDGIITALECLAFDPSLARGVLAFLAATQATDNVPAQDAQPGKILHEARGGEMATLHEIPFGRYYGSVDATPLFVLLAGAYYERTGDRAFLESIWPNVEAALRWIDTQADPDGDGFVEYARQTPQGLSNQGWKDAHDAIFHADGTLADGPIALCEVQGYVYAAKQSIAAVARVLGGGGFASELESQARALQSRFEQAFWCDDLSVYALALDGAKKPCRVRTSNSGQCLFSGICSSERARRVGNILLGPTFFSGWGVRTVAEGEARYNPMAYHNGSVWPHDNALIAAGLSRYGLQDDTRKIASGLFAASVFLDLHRLPELFCGFVRRPGEGPTLYPVACSPQSWSAAAVFLLVQSCLGLTVSATARQICFVYPVLPGFLRELRIHNLSLPGASTDLLLRRVGQDVSIHVLRREGDVEVRMVK